VQDARGRLAGTGEQTPPVFENPSSLYPGAKRRADQIPPSSFEGGRYPTITALDLANLAVRVCPELCKSNPKAAFLEAVAFYHLAVWFIDENKERDFVSLSLDSTELITTGVNLPLMDSACRELMPAFKKARVEKTESEKIHFYPKAQKSGDVLDFLRVKTERAVREKFRKWFVALRKDKLRGEKDFEMFWNETKAADAEGNVYHAISKRTLEELRKFEQEKGKETKRKAWEKRRQNKSSV
jgi:hypothetical protein